MHYHYPLHLSSSSFERERTNNMCLPKLFHLIRNTLIRSNLQTCELFLLAFLLIASIFPLFYPNNWPASFGGYLLIKEHQIKNDLIECSPHPTSPSTHINWHTSPCPLTSPHLGDNLPVKHTISLSFDEIARNFSISEGGHHKPAGCVPLQKVAIIIPYRNRWNHLQLFLQHIHAFLHSQPIEYTIYVITQAGLSPFNRGKLFNIAFVEVQKSDYCCFIFHDVDLLPINRKQLYACSHTPKHLCYALDKFRFNLLYPHLFGGAIAMNRTQFELVNGFSNQFEGWGGEDDDMYNRLVDNHLHITRWESDITRCVMLTHKSEKPNPMRLQLLKEGKQRFYLDGINNVIGNYKVISIEKESLYTNITVEL